MKPLLFVLFSLGFSLVAPALDTPGQVTHPLPISGKLYSDYRKLLQSPPQGASENRSPNGSVRRFCCFRK